MPSTIFTCCVMPAPDAGFATSSVADPHTVVAASNVASGESCDSSLASASSGPSFCACTTSPLGSVNVSVPDTCSCEPSSANTMAVLPAGSNQRATVLGPLASCWRAASADALLWVATADVGGVQPPSNTASANPASGIAKA